MKILFFHPLTGYLWRGIERNVVGLASSCTELGHAVCILTIRHPEQALLRDLDPRVRVVQAPHSRYFTYACGVPFFVTHLACHPYDAVVVFFGGFGVGPSLSAVRKFRDIPFYVYLGYPIDVAPWRYAEFERWQLPARAAGVWAHGEPVAEQAAIRFGRNVEALPTGVDVARFRPDPTARRRVRSDLRLRDDAPVLLTVAALDERKGIQHVLEALPLVREAIPDVTYLVAGEGQYEGRLREQIERLGLHNTVRMLGAQTRVEELYAAADVFCLLAEGEAGPNVVYEALAAQVPVVTVDAPPVNQHLGSDVAELLRGTDPHRVADALVNMLTDSSRRERMGNAGRMLVDEHYSFDSLARLLVRLMNGEDVHDDTSDVRRRSNAGLAL